MASRNAIPHARPFLAEGIRERVDHLAEIINETIREEWIQHGTYLQSHMIRLRGPLTEPQIDDLRKRFSQFSFLQLEGKPDLWLSLFLKYPE